MNSPPICDRCHQTLHAAANGRWVSLDESPSCPLNDAGHTVQGSVTA